MTAQVERMRASAAARWRLTGFKTVREAPNGAVWTAQAESWGSVVLKWDDDPARVRAAYGMLLQLDGRACCRVYACDVQEGLLLEERVMPGESLRAVTSLRERVEAFAAVFGAIHGLPGGEADYLAWLDDACRFCKGTRDAQAQAWAELARSCCAQLFEAYADRTLLHGDLHHDNLLRRSCGGYAMIDPKAVTGPAILDVPRFLINELGTPYTEADTAHIQRVAGLLSERLHYPLADVWRAGLMEAVLANVWRMEDGGDADPRLTEIAACLRENLARETQLA